MPNALSYRRIIIRNRLGRMVWMMRVTRGLSQYALAGKIRTSRSAISCLERGEKLPNVETLERVARALKVPVWLLLRLTEVEVA